MIFIRVKKYIQTMKARKIIDKNSNNQFKKFTNNPLCITRVAYQVRLFVLCLCMGLSSVGRALAESTERTDWRKNFKLGFEVKAGLPFGKLLSEIMKDEPSIRDVEASSNWRFGVVGAYAFPFSNGNWAVGPEIGVFTETGTKLGLTMINDCGDGEVKFSVQERFIAIPLALRLTTYDREVGIKENGFTLGWEFRVLLSSKLSVTDEEGRQGEGSLNEFVKNANNPLKGNGTQNSVNLPKLDINFFLGGQVGIYKGCYITGKIKFPVTNGPRLVKAMEAENEVGSLAYGIRLAGEPMVELGIGANIMRWFS